MKSNYVTHLRIHCLCPLKSSWISDEARAPLFECALLSPHPRRSFRATWEEVRGFIRPVLQSWSAQFGYLIFRPISKLTEFKKEPASAGQRRPEKTAHGFYGPPRGRFRRLTRDWGTKLSVFQACLSKAVPWEYWWTGEKKKPYFLPGARRPRLYPLGTAEAKVQKIEQAIFQYECASVRLPVHSTHWRQPYLHFRYFSTLGLVHEGHFHEMGALCRSREKLRQIIWELAGFWHECKSYEQVLLDEISVACLVNAQEATLSALAL